MTALIALVGTDSVFMAADSRRTEIASGRALEPVSKLKVLKGPILWSKGGYGADADELFELVAADERGQSGDIDQVEKATYEHGLAVYEKCKLEAERQKQDDLGLYVLIAGHDQSGKPAARSILFETHERKGIEPGSYVVLATDTEKARAIVHQMESQYVSDGRVLNVGAYGLAAMKRISAAMPDSVGLPVELAVARRGLPLTRSRASHGHIFNDAAFKISI